MTTPLPSRNRIPADSLNLILALCLGLLHGLIYIFALPVWQHYDEPTHFEYAWLIANKGRLPSPKEYDLEMRREVALSMIESGFFKPLGFLPDVNSDKTPAWIGPISQLTNPPLYYLLAAVPIRLLAGYDVNTQLYAVRFLSLLFFLVLIFTAWGIAREISPPGHLLRILLPLTVALLPGLTDIMTSVNNDVAAITFVSLCLWGCIRLVKMGVNGLTLIWCIAAVTFCMLSKETAYVALPMFVLALIFAIFRSNLRIAAWASLIAVILIGMLLSISTGDAASWYRGTSQSSNTRKISPQAVEGKYAFSLETGVEVTPPWSRPVFQPIPYFPQLSGGDQTFTLGAWIWASQPAQVNTPILGDGHALHFHPVEVGVEPAFYVITGTVDVQPDTRLWVGLDPGIRDQNIEVWYDGLVLVNQPVPLQEQPQYPNPDQSEVAWGGIVVPNLIRNGSAEVSGLRVVHLVDQIGAKILPDRTRPSMILTYGLDWNGASWHYRLTAERLLRTFWGQFGWAHINLIGHRPYRWLGIATLVCLLGFSVWLIRNTIRGMRRFPWEIAVIMAFLLVGVWVGTASRGVIYLGNNRLYLPVARYAYPAIVSTLVVLCLGYLELLQWARGDGRLSNIIPRVQLVIWVVFFVILDILSVVSITTYYRGLGLG